MTAAWQNENSLHGRYPEKGLQQVIARSKTIVPLPSSFPFQLINLLFNS